MKIIAACSKNWVIGKDNKLPWSESEELELFKETTLNNVIIMGRKTYEGIGKLKNRVNIVFSSEQKEEGDLIFVRTFEDFFDIINIFHGMQKYVIGGASIFEEFLKRGLINEILLSIFNFKVEGDKYFPYYHLDKFKIKDTIIYTNFTRYNYILC